MAFCQRCGTQLSPDTVFCPGCGAPAQQNQQPPVQSYPQSYQPQYQQPMVVVRTPVPGRGFGITSMVLGIIGLVYGFLLMCSLDNFRDFSDYEDMFSSFIPVIIVYSSLSIMAVIFGSCAKNRGYINGISKSGLIMGWIGIGCYILSILICMA